MLGLFTSPFFIAFLAGVTTYVLWRGITNKSRSSATSAAERRLEQVMSQSGLYEDVSMEGITEKEPNFIDKMVKTLTSQGTFTALEQGDILSFLENKLMLAGNPKGWHAREFISYYFLIVSGGVVLSLFMLSANMSRIMVAGLMLFAFLYPFAVLNRWVKERQEKIFAELPDLLDEMVLSLSSGVGTLEGALEQVILDANQYHKQTGKEKLLAREFERAYREYRYGDRNWDEAFNDAADRTGLSEVTSLVEGLNEAKRGGAPIRDVLEDMSKHIYAIYQTKMLEFIEKKSVSFVVSLTMIMLGIMVIIISPVFAQVIGSLSS